MTGKPQYLIFEGKKVCRDCRKPKTLRHFQRYRGSNGKHYYKGACRECQRVINNQYQSEHREIWRKAAKKWAEAKLKADPDYYRKRYRRKLLRQAGLLKKMANPHPFRPWPVHAQMIREQLQQPIMVDGRRYICSRDAAIIVGHRPDYLRHIAARYSGEGPHLTAEGFVFVRRPRGKTDQRAPLYWLESSLQR